MRPRPPPPYPVAMTSTVSHQPSSGNNSSSVSHVGNSRLSASQLQQVLGFIEAHGHAKLEALAGLLGLSVFQVQRGFKGCLGVTPAQYARSQRLARLKGELEAGSNVTEAAFAAGFAASNRAGDDPQLLAMTPSAYRRGGAGVRLRLVVLPSSLGQVLVAATERGLAAVLVGEDEATLLAELRAEYPAAEFLASDEQVQAWARLVVAALYDHQAQAALLALPLDVQATAFQAKVWQALRQIPLAQTRSYRQVAQALGEPQAMRAVAGACAANRLALVIPCHRVVRSDGSLSGYRWGPTRKRWLLDNEAKLGLLALEQRLNSA
jgi:AraC family transcriptional regulator, regulatory protein of adaptative response / methylated-DNA-[protein]-cysteine methyltransferase